MTMRVALLWVALAAPLAAQSPSATTGGDKPVAISTAKAIRLCADCTGRQHEFDVTVRTKTQPTLPPVVVDVVLDDAREPARRADFTFTWKTDTQGKTTRTTLVLTVADTLRRPGEYDVTVNLTPDNAADPVLEHVTVMIPPAKIEQPEKIVVSRTVYTPEWLGRSSVERQALVLHETGRLSGVRALKGRTDRIDSENKPVAASVEVPDLALPAGGSNADVPYALEGTFPLGISTGKLRLTAEELSEPIVMDVEVQSRLAWWYLLATIVAGLVVSWWVKVRLAEDIARSQAEALANQLLGDIEADKKRYAEPDFARDVQADTAALQGALANRVATTIEQKRSALDKTWRDAVHAAVTRRAAFKADIESFSALIDLRWTLPAPFGPALTEARRAVAALKSADLIKLDARVSELAGVRKTFLDALEAIGGGWQDGVALAFTDALGPRHGFPAEMATSLSATVSAWATEYPRVGRLPQQFDEKRIEPTLRTLAGQHLAARDLADWIGRQLTRTATEVALGLEQPPATLSNVIAAIAAVRVAAANAVDQPDAHAQALATAVGGLQDAWLNDIVPKLDPAVQNDARADIANHLYVAAARRRPEEKLLGGGGAAAVVAQVLETLRLPQLGTWSPAPAAVSVSTPEAGRYVALAVRSQAQLRRAKSLQSVIVGILFLGWALGSFGASWNGTWEGLLTVFFSAVAIDVAADKLLGKIG